jgi:hypothetical protein
MLSLQVARRKAETVAATAKAGLRREERTDALVAVRASASTSLGVAQSIGELPKGSDAILATGAAVVFFGIVESAKGAFEEAGLA